MCRLKRVEQPVIREPSLAQIRDAYRFAMLELDHEIRECEQFIVARIQQRERLKSTLAAIDAALSLEQQK